MQLGGWPRAAEHLCAVSDQHLVSTCFMLTGALCEVQTGPGSVVSDGDALQYTATAFNGADLETGSIFSKDDDMGPDDERWRKRFRRRVKVRHIASLCTT